MTTKPIKISELNYEWLCKIAGKMQTEQKKIVSMDEALTQLRRSKPMSELAGSWKMNDKEASKLLARIKKGWSTWNQKSV